MLRSILITYPLPCTTITAFGLLISNEFLIVTVYFLILSKVYDEEPDRKKFLPGFLYGKRGNSAK